MKSCGTISNIMISYECFLSNKKKDTVRNSVAIGFNAGSI